jgi:N6-L-threonylcarbamoyladenine synthase
MIVLGIESSCDETAVAVVQSDGLVLADVVSSQVALHAPYGGVVPELAARAHMQNIIPVAESALAESGRELTDIDGVAVTHGPGLIGALLVGVQAGKAIAMARKLPLVGVNHLVGHLLSVFLRRSSEDTAKLPSFPFIALLVSGGHTALYEVRSAFDIEQLGQTRDDAAGEAFDKVAKLLGLGYPGGPRVDKLASQGDAKRVSLPRPMAQRNNLEFSFSGLKTAVAQRLLELGPLDEQGVADVCAAFQSNVVSVLVKKSLAACEARGVARLVLTGGVAANRGLRALAAEATAKAGIALYVPPFASCTDNAAMIAYAGAQRLLRGDDDGFGLSVFSRSPILGVAPGTAAARRYKSSRLPRT